MVMSDVILMGFSGFSWCASILSNAKIYYINKINKYNLDNNWFLDKWNKINETKTSTKLMKDFINNIIKS